MQGNNTFQCHLMPITQYQGTQRTNTSLGGADERSLSNREKGSKNQGDRELGMPSRLKYCAPKKKIQITCAPNKEKKAHTPEDRGQIME